MKKCYCGQENEDLAAKCVACGSEEFIGQQKTTASAQPPMVAPPKVQEAGKEEVARLTVYGGFRLRVADVNSSRYRTVATSLGGLKKGILMIGHQQLVLKQRLTVAGGFLLGAASLILALIFLGLGPSHGFDTWFGVFLLLLLLSGTFAVPLFFALWIRRFNREFKLTDITTGAVHGEELELHIQSGAGSAGGPASATAELVIKPQTKAALPALTKILSESGVTIKEAGHEEMNAFVDRLLAATPRAWVTISLMAVNVAFFTVLAVDSNGSFSPVELLKWGADFGPLTVNSGQWWRVLANCFLHFGFVHLFCNMFALFQAGRLTERLFGNWLFLLIYLGCGLVGSLTSLWFNPNTMAAGASGAVFGVFGALLGYLMRECGGLPRRVVMPVFQGVAVMVVWNLFYGFLNVANHYAATATPGGHAGGQVIDMAAHCGGLVSGLIFGYLGARPLETDERRRLATARGAAVAIGMVVLMGLLMVPVLTTNRPDVARMKMLANSYYNGEGLPKDREKAFEWFKGAAEAGDSESERSIGAMYRSGDGVGKDTAEGMRWFTKAAEQGDVLAEKFLMSAYFAGVDVPTNALEGVKWLAKVANQGADQDCAQVERAVGASYYSGEGLPKNEAEGIKWLKRAATNGDAPAKKALKAIEEMSIAPGPGDVWLMRYVALRERGPGETIMEALRSGLNLDAAAAKVGEKVSAPKWYKPGGLQKPIEDALGQLQPGGCALVETDKGFYVVGLLKVNK